MKEWPIEYEACQRAIEVDPPTKQEVILALQTLHMTATVLGGPAWSDELLGRLLAWSWLAGFPECCVLNTGMATTLIVASYRFGIRGGNVPDLELMQKWVGPPFRELRRQGAKTKWLPALMDRYRVTGWEKLNYQEWVGDEDVAVWIKSRDRNRPLLPA